MAGFFAIGALAPDTPEAKEKARQRATIELCWDDQARKSNAAGTAQFIAATCERMEQNFRDRWGVNP